MIFAIAQWLIACACFYVRSETDDPIIRAIYWSTGMILFGISGIAFRQTRFWQTATKGQTSESGETSK